jgi:histone H3/H4
MSLIVKSSIKEVVKDMNVSEDVALELEKKAEQLLKDGEKRAKANGRRTIYARDL